MGNSFGTSLELVGKSDVFVLECCGECTGAAGEGVGNLSGAFTNYLGNN